MEERMYVVLLDICQHEEDTVVEDAIWLFLIEDKMDSTMRIRFYVHSAI